MFVILLNLIGAVYAFFQGFFEMHSTPEQHEKALLISGIFIIIYSSAMIALFLLRRSLKRRNSS